MVADNTAFGLALDMALPFFFYLAKTESDRRLRWFFGLAFITGIPAIFFTYSRGAFVGLIAVAMFMFLQSNQKMVLSLIAIVALIFGAFLAPQKFRDRIGETTNTTESSAASRLNEWAYSWHVANAFPVTGGGFEAFTPALYRRYAPDPRDVHGPHSIYFGIILEHGFVGFILYFSLVGYCFFALHWIAKQARLRGDEEAIDYAHILRFSLIGFLGAGAFLGRTYFDFYFMIVACTAILRQVCREEWAADADSEEEGADDADTSLSEHAYV
jgi:putative inorganic carbon (HCO3(-)) transporter